jgi:quercetin dioxygenase-like cupin family protein
VHLPKLVYVSLFSLLCYLLFGLGALTPAAAQSEAPIAIAHDDPELEWHDCFEFLPDECRFALLHGDPEKPNTDVFFELPADSHIAHHWHTSAERILLVSGEFHVNYDGHPPVVLRPGTYAYGPAKLPHDAYCAPGDPCLLFIAFEDPVDAVPTED